MGTLKKTYFFLVLKQHVAPTLIRRNFGPELSNTPLHLGLICRCPCMVCRLSLTGAEGLADSDEKVCEGLFCIRPNPGTVFIHVVVVGDIRPNRCLFFSGSYIVPRTSAHEDADSHEYCCSLSLGGCTPWSRRSVLLLACEVAASLGTHDRCGSHISECMSISTASSILWPLRVLMYVGYM